MVTARVTKLKEMKTRKLLEKHKIRSCYVKLFRINVQGGEASRNTLKEQGVRECSVVLFRLKTDFPSKNPPKLLSQSENFASVRSNVAWLPTKSSTECNSVGAIAFLAAHRDSGQNSAMKRRGKTFPRTVPTKRQRIFFDDNFINERQLKSSLNGTISAGAAVVNQNSFHSKGSIKTVRFSLEAVRNETAKSKSKLVPMKRQRSRSMDSSADNSQSKHTMDEFFEELLEKRKNLKPVNERVLQSRLELGQVPLWKQIHSEFQKKLDAKK